MKLQRVSSRNHKTLTSTDIVLSDSITLLVGPNHCGKTATLRLVNRPLNDRRFGSTDPMSVAADEPSDPVRGFSH